MNFINPAKYLRSNAFDTATEQGRTHERYRLALFGIGANLLSRVTSMAVMLFTVSLTVSYLGAERFGIWMTISSLAGMLSFLDLGVANALTNKVAEASSDAQTGRLANIISGGLGFLFLLSISVIFLLNALASIVPWELLIKVDNELNRTEIEHTVYVFSVLFGITIFTGGVQRIFYGLQRSFEAHLYAIGGSLLSLSALSIAARYEADIPWLLASAMIGPITANFLLIFRLIKRNIFIFAGIMNNICLQARNLIKLGGLFFLLQLGVLVTYGADSLIISSTLGASSVAILSVTQRLFQFAYQPLSVINASLWPAFADAHAYGDRTFIQKTLKKALVGSLLVGMLLSLAIVCIGQFFIYKWTSGLVTVSLELLSIYGIWTVFNVLADAFSMFLNGCSVIKPQVYGVLALVIISLPLKYFLIANFGIEAMLAGFLIFSVCNLIFWYGCVFQPEIRKALI